MRSTFGRLVGRGALLAALGFGGFGSLYGVSGHSGDVAQLADWNWDSLSAFADVEPSGGDASEPAPAPTHVEELDWNWD